MLIDGDMVSVIKMTLLRCLGYVFCFVHFRVPRYVTREILWDVVDELLRWCNSSMMLNDCTHLISLSVRL